MKTKKLTTGEHHLSSHKIKVNNDLTLEHIRCLDLVNGGILWHAYYVNEVEVDIEGYYKVIMSIQAKPLQTDAE